MRKLISEEEVYNILCKYEKHTIFCKTITRRSKTQAVSIDKYSIDRIQNCLQTYNNKDRFEICLENIKEISIDVGQDIAKGIKYMLITIAYNPFEYIGLCIRL